MDKPPLLTRESLRHFLNRGAIYAVDQEHFCLGWNSGRSDAAAPVTLSFLSPDFFLQSAHDREWLPHRHMIVRRTDVEQALHEYLTEESHAPHSLRWQSPTREIFAERFAALKQLMATEMISKGVPYGQARASMLIDPLWIAHRLEAALRKGKGASLYGMWDTTEGIIGCSPERLCEFIAAKKLLTTEAVAGTMPLASYQVGALLNDAKAVQEHRFVIEDLTERLSCLGTVEIGATMECAVPGLVHLKTPLQVRLASSEVSPTEIIGHLHPTAALGTYPRNGVGQTWLEETNQQLPRWRFGAPFGLSRHRSDCGKTEGFSFLVAIRGVQWREQDVRINAGCGVIASSQLDAEWEECLAKIASIKTLFEL